MTLHAVCNLVKQVAIPALLVYCVHRTCTRDMLLGERKSYQEGAQVSVYTTRKNNLLKLRRQWQRMAIEQGLRPTDAALARRMGIGRNHLSAMLAEDGRSMGNEIARRIEERMNLPDGWMDQAHPDLSDEAIGVASMFDELGEEGRRAVLALLETLTNK